jgi:hypothetical protein
VEGERRKRVMVRGWEMKGDSGGKKNAKTKLGMQAERKGG